MYDCTEFFIDGEWVAPQGRARLEVIDPATEAAIGHISSGNVADVDRAVRAARGAFDSYSRTSREERVALLERVIAAYERNRPRLARAISDEMGAPIDVAMAGQTALGLAHLTTAVAILKEFEFEESLGATRLFREPIGVCGLITPWNWPLNQIGCKVAPALATGCTMVLKPSEVAPLSAHVFAEILQEAGVPPGVFNLVDGEGGTVGAAMASHPEIDMVSFTGSTRAGVLVAKAAADTVKRVSQELGGKSPNIILEGADLEAAVTRGALAMTLNSGQSCNAPSRMLVPAHLHDAAAAIARRAIERVVIGDPRKEGVAMGPVANRLQFEKIQALLQAGIDEGAELVTGGPGRPAGISAGYYVRPTVFANVRNDMTVARQEIFGPVLVIIPYETEAEAVSIANDTVYGLSAYVQAGNPQKAREVGSRLRAGMVHLNGATIDLTAPFGGYKQSGNGREWGREGFREFLETKAMMGCVS